METVTPPVKLLASLTPTIPVTEEMELMTQTLDYETNHAVVREKAMENCVPLNNVLVIQDQDQSQWSDYCGSIDFIFTNKAFIKELAILDIDDRDDGEATVKVR